MAHVRNVPWAAFALVACGLVAPARAEELAGTAPREAERMPWKRWALQVGGYVSRLESTVRLGSGATGTALELNLERAFGLDTSTSAVRAGAYARVSENLRHRVALDFYGTTRSASKTLVEDITIDGTTFVAGTTVAAKTSLDILKASYAYSFLLDDRIDLAASAGVYTMPFRFRFDGTSRSEAQDFTAPLPVVGLHLDFAVTPTVFMRKRLDLFYLAYGDFKGSLGSATVAVEWFPWESVGVALGYESLSLGVEASSDDYPGLDLRGNVKYLQNGLFSYVTFAP